MADICLTSSEIADITNKTRYAAQARELNRLGIDHQIRADGSVLVFRCNIESKKPATRQAAPDFGALKNVS